MATLISCHEHGVYHIQWNVCYHPDHISRHPARVAEPPVAASITGVPYYRDDWSDDPDRTTRRFIGDPGDEVDRIWNR
jgi:hypothetical protein